jgi:hypothetical protein
MKADRSLLKKYFNSKNHRVRNQIERTFQGDDLVMDAFEGFHSDKQAWRQFEKFDRHFNKSVRMKRYLFLCVSLSLSLIIGWNFIPAFKTKTHKERLSNQPKEEGIIIHRQQQIVKMQAVAKSDVITPKQVLLESVVQVQKQESKMQALEKMKQMPAQRIELKKDASNRLALTNGRELYIKNFKVIDYRYYRKEQTKNNLTQEENEFAEKTIKIPYFNLLSTAIEDFAQSNYKLALLHFDEILAVYADDANALFYGAMCLFNLGEYTQAENRLVKLQNITMANFREEANWYLLRVYKQTKQKADFNQLRTQVIENNGFYANKALELRFE